MSRRSGKVVLGIDVGEKNSWCIAMDQRRRIILSSSLPIGPEDLPDIIRRVRPSVVAIDAPRSWAREGKSRKCERDLHNEGIHCFFTPVESGTKGKKFYGWVRTGIRFYEAASGFRCRVIEVFPHSAEARLLSSWRAQKSKARRRRRLLMNRGVTPADIRDHCTNIHRTDAAVCALIGLLCLERRTSKVGDSAEGAIVVPSRSRR